MSAPAVVGVDVIRKDGSIMLSDESILLRYKFDIAAAQAAKPRPSTNADKRGQGCDYLRRAFAKLYKAEQGKLDGATLIDREPDLPDMGDAVMMAAKVALLGVSKAVAWVTTKPEYYLDEVSDAMRHCKVAVPQSIFQQHYPLDDEISEVLKERGRHIQAAFPSLRQSFLSSVEFMKDLTAGDEKEYAKKVLEDCGQDAGAARVYLAARAQRVDAAKFIVKEIGETFVAMTKREKRDEIPEVKALDDKAPAPRIGVEQPEKKADADVPVLDGVLGDEQ